MADEDKTPETEEQAPDSIQEEVQTAASEEGAGASVSGDERSEAASTVDQPDEPPAAEAAPAAPQAAAEPQEVLAPKERRARRRADKQPAARGPMTPEQRDDARRPRADDP